MKPIPGRYICVLQPCDVGIMKILTEGVRLQNIEWPSKKQPNVAASNVLPVSDRHVVSVCVSSVFELPLADRIKATFQHIGLTSDEVSAPFTPYPSTPFLYVQKSHTNDGPEKDIVDL